MGKFKKAYSLVELAITIAIIGLLIAMTMQAQKFLAENKNKKIISEIEKITQALSEFKLKHNFLAGDFPYTSSYYSNLSSAYNGNGNGRLDDIITGAISEAEIIPAILQEAGYLPDFSYASDKQIKSQAVELASWFFTCHRSCTAGMYEHDYADASFNLAVDDSWTPALAAKTAYNLDIKIDDGKAKQGKIMGFDDSGSYSCALGNGYDQADDGSSYNMSETGLDCVLQVNLKKLL